jgi:hypothetical protein
VRVAPASWIVTLVSILIFIALSPGSSAARPA